jgi:hypothetical protein
MKTPLPAVMLGLLLLAGCTVSGSSPSLAPRAVEREYSNAPPPTGPCRLQGDGCFEGGSGDQPVPPPPANDVQLRARIEALLGSARAGQAAFARQLEDTVASVSRAGVQGSDAWIAAQQALSRLEAARAPAVDALTEFDALMLARSTQPTSETDRALLASGLEEVRRLADAQGAEVERLRAALATS